MDTPSSIDPHGEAEVRPIDRRRIPGGASETRWDAADGHRVRRIDLPTEGETKGSILFLPGRGDAYEKYLESLVEWQRAGWQVTALDWRGQAGSGRFGSDDVTGHIDDFDIWIDDLSTFWKQWKAASPAPHILMGHSMGGHLTLRAVAEKRVDPTALVLSAPMLGFVGDRLPSAVMHGAAKLMKALGDATRPAWKWSEKPGEMPASRQLLLTHDDERYADELFWREERPDLVMGPGSWGWVERAYASMRSLDRPGVLEAVETPVLIVATSADRLVSTRAVERAAERLPNAKLVMFGDEARHEILREENGVRDKAMSAIETFLEPIARRRESA